MDDLIVIILTLIVAVFGVVGQIRKKKATQTGSGDQKKPSGFWDMLVDEADHLAQEQEVVYEDEVLIENQSIKQKEEYNYSETNDENFTVRKKITKEVNKKDNTSKIRKGFSLRKAVIYSEILNRKYT